MLCFAVFLGSFYQGLGPCSSLAKTGLSNEPRLEESYTATGEHGPPARSEWERGAVTKGERERGGETELEGAGVSKGGGEKCRCRDREGVTRWWIILQDYEVIFSFWYFSAAKKNKKISSQVQPPLRSGRVM